MYLHLGNDIAVRKKEIVAVFDLDNTSQSAQTRRFLTMAEKSGDAAENAPPTDEES